MHFLKWLSQFWSRSSLNKNQVRYIHDTVLKLKNENSTILKTYSGFTNKESKFGKWDKQATQFLNHLYHMGKSTCYRKLMWPFGCKPKLLAQTVKIPRRSKAILFPPSLIYVLKKSNILLITINKHSGGKLFKIFSTERLLKS